MEVVGRQKWLEERRHGYRHGLQVYQGSNDVSQDLRLLLSLL